MPRPIHVEVVADDPDASANFFTDVFGWKIQRWEGEEEYWLATTGEDPEPGIDGAIMRRQEEWQYPVIVIGVPSIEEYLDKIRSAGGEIVRGKSEIPNVGYAAYFKDPAGNYFGIFQPVQAAAP